MVDSGLIQLTGLQSLLAGRTDPGWILAVAGPVADGFAPLWRADVIVGPQSDYLREKVWVYESCTFVSAGLTSGLLAERLAGGSIQEMTLGEVVLQFELQTNCNFQRKSSLAQNEEFKLTWPTNVYLASLVEPPQQFQPPAGFIIGPGAPSFVTFGVAFNAFFQNNYALTGTSNPLLGQLTLRVCDVRGRITSVAIQSTQLEVAVEGAALDHASVELMGVSDRDVVPVSGNRETAIPLPNGLPDDAWIWLRSNEDWFDYRSLGGWAAYRSPDVRDERITEPEADLAAMIAQGENVHVEFKRHLPANTSNTRRTALKTVVAFANGDGGTVLYGIEDDGGVFGLPEADGATEDSYVNVLRASTSPMPPCHCSVQDLAGKRVLVVDVEANAGTIFALTVEPDKHEFFVRRGATTFPARAEELQSILHRGQSAVLPGLGYSYP